MSVLPSQTISQLFPLQKHFHSVPPPVIKWVNKFILFIENEGAFCSAGYQDKYGTEESFKASPLWMKAQEYENWLSRALVTSQPSIVLKSQVTVTTDSCYSRTIFWMTKGKKNNPTSSPSDQLEYLLSCCYAVRKLYIDVRYWFWNPYIQGNIFTYIYLYMCISSDIKFFLSFLSSL